MQAGKPPARVRILGGEVDLVTPAQMLGRVESAVGSGRAAVIANHNAHSLYLLRGDKGLRAFFAGADLVQIDSVPVIAWGALLGLGLARRHRSTYLDWREEFWRRADRRGWRVFYLGGAPGVAERACARVGRAWPNAVLACHDGFFDPAPASAGNRAALAAIAAFAPDVLMVGMGMPRQEHWIADNRAALGPAVILPVGAAFDYEAGVQQTPPRWSGRFGVEWLFRLAADPRRLAKRYLIEPWLLLPLAFADLAAARRRLTSPGSAGRRGASAPAP
ncbi:MAG TPA: WecB/TagA/CpsF family glycosyltransferase [Caulobacteraceae bacterium]